MKIKVNEERCKSCGLCIAFCPKQVLAISDKRNLHGYKVVYFKHSEKCNLCGVCYLMCPDVVFERVGDDE
jgi:2-oxoglutarate ferredoxin oxidoreductase subunit delta